MPGISRHPRFFWRGDTEVLLGVDILAIGTVLPAGPGGRTPGRYLAGLSEHIFF